MIEWLIDRFVNWVSDWLIVGLINWQIDWQLDWLIDWQIYSLIEWLIGWLTDRQVDWMTVELSAWLIDWLTGRVTASEIIYLTDSWLAPDSIETLWSPRQLKPLGVEKLSERSPTSQVKSSQVYFQYHCENLQGRVFQSPIRLIQD